MKTLTRRQTQDSHTPFTVSSVEFHNWAHLHPPPSPRLHPASAPRPLRWGLSSWFPQRFSAPRRAAPGPWSLGADSVRRAAVSHVATFQEEKAKSDSHRAFLRENIAGFENMVA